MRIHRTRARTSLAALLLATLPAIATAQNAATLVQGVQDAAVLGELSLRPIGPAVMSGRVSDIDVAHMPGERLGRVIWVATAGGGVWRSTNGGKTWDPVFERQPVASIGDVTVAPSNPDIVWVGSGESNNLRSSSWGNGIYKSTDGGDTWTHVGLPTSQHVPRILVHPTNPDIVYVAAMGPLWRSGGERGVYKTTDGGRTWARILFVNETTGATDLVFDPTNPDVLYAALMQRERKPYSFVAGGPASGVYKSTDGGANWRKLENGLPAGDKGRIGIDVSLAQPRTVYAFVDAQQGGVFRSDDGGESWTRQSNLNTLPWFTGQVRADTENPDRVYHLGQQLSVSDDGGRNWQRIAQSTHADHHAMWINPNDANHVLIGNDGGFYLSYDGAVTWDFANNLPASTFYAIGVDMRDPYWVYGGLQDNGTWGAPSRSRNRTGVGNTDWVNVGGGDGFYAQIDPTDPLTMYSESQNGALQRVDLPTDERKSIRPPAEEGLRYRFNWSAPLVISRYDNRTLYFGGNYLFKSTDRGDSWSRLGGDLTRNADMDTLPIMGMKAAGGYRRHEGTAAFGNIATIAESPLRRGLLYVGTDDGVVQVTRDDGANWRRIERFPGVPDLTYVSRVLASAHDEGTVYVTLDGHRDNDFRPYVLKSTDFGATWTSIASNLPAEGSVQVIAEHPRNRDLLFVGTEFGLFVSIDGGRAWAPMRANFPTVAIHDMLIHPRDNDLVVGTHGRGIYILDDITPLEKLAETARAGAPLLFTPRAAVAYNPSGGPGSPGDRGFFGANPEYGALLTYYLPAGTSGDVSLAIVDGRGTLVRELPAKAEPGVHRIPWDLRWASPTGAPEPDPDDEDEGPGFGAFRPSGPMAAEGTYTAQLRIANGGQSRVASEARLQVRRDPAARLTAAQYADLIDWRMRAYDVQREANALVNELTQTRERLVQGMRGADTTSAAGQRMRDARAALDASLEKLRGRQGGFGGRGGGFGGGGAQNSVLGMVNGPAGVIATSHFLVSDGQKQQITAARSALDAERPAARRAIDAASAVSRTP